jgi:hypothetical protein
MLARSVHTTGQASELAMLSCPADTARPPLGLTETLQEGQRRHSSDLERAESLVRPCCNACRVAPPAPVLEASTASC